MTTLRPRVTTWALTFGQVWRHQPHPSGRPAHPDGWVSITATDYSHALVLAEYFYGRQWAQLRPASEIVAASFPLGELDFLVPPAEHCHRCSFERLGREHAEGRLQGLIGQLEALGLVWTPGERPDEPGLLATPTGEPPLTVDQEASLATFRAQLGLVDGLGDGPVGPCGVCGRPYSPTHDEAAPGPTAKHPYQGWAPRAGD